MRRRVPGWIGLPRLDWPLLLALLLLMGGGLAVLYSASGGDGGTVLRQCVRMGAGLVALLTLSLVPPHILRTWTPWLYVFGLVLVVATLLAGEGRGASRWLDFGVVRFQPSEIMKLAVPMIVAWYFHPRELPPAFRDVLAAFCLLAAPAVLIAQQPDLGTALLIGISGCITIFLAGLRWRMIFGLAGLAAAAAPALWLVMHEYQRNRVRTFLNPESDPLGTGWNIIQSEIAVGSGGLLGKGWLNGTQSRLEFIPERHTDFILAVLAEEFGLIGVLVLLILYAFITGRCAFIAAMAKDTYSRLLAGSLGFTFFVYVLVNAGMVSGLLPVVGVPLPLVSYGGTSIVTLLAAFGIVMSIHGHRKFLR
ncbi:rod shape-determining protein RodA [Elongatibacter sediminis]|uniref:Peptidoglycan glycosyltransferase MrdB n=1 Tax=Elongatibacter sediminis TaxID=3119006 RepID=A0AAW9RDR3_9GAMM